MTVIKAFGAHAQMTVHQALNEALEREEEKGLEEVLIIGTCKETGNLFIRSSAMLNKDVVYLLEEVKLSILMQAFDDEN